MDDDWIIVRNWERFQHYKDRHPAWIKLYTELAHKDEWEGLSASQRGLLVTIWIEYALGKGQIRVRFVREKMQRSFREVSLQALVHAGFIELSASKPLARCYQRASADLRIKRKTPPTPPAQKAGEVGEPDIPRDPDAARLMRELADRIGRP